MQCISLYRMFGLKTWQAEHPHLAAGNSLECTAVSGPNHGATTLLVHSPLVQAAGRAAGTTKPPGPPVGMTVLQLPGRTGEVQYLIVQINVLHLEAL